MLKIGIIGDSDPVSGLGGIITNNTTCIYSGCYQPNPKSPGDISGNSNAPAFASFQDFLSNCDAIIVESIDHIDSGNIIEALKDSKHILLEKPMDWQDEELEYLFKLAEEANTFFQLRETFLFDPVIKAAEPFIHAPAFIDYQIGISSEAPMEKLPDMIVESVYQCLDTIFHLNPGRVSKYDTVFSPDLFGFPGVIHGRIEFDNGCIANITCNGYAEQNKSICYIYQENRHAILNFQSQRLVIKDKTEEEEKPKSFNVPLTNSDPQVEEILHFTGMILNKSFHLTPLDRYVQSFMLARKMIENLPIHAVHV
ncbi:Gfo/Idh/MocA family oxidoreductase [Bacteroidota bacterium]